MAADGLRSESVVYLTVAEEADHLLGLTIPTERGRQFPTREEFDKCLAFLARLSGNPGWDFLRKRETTDG